MILEIQHETRLEYTQPVIESMVELRMEPVSGPEQSCHSFHLAISPPAERFRFQDGVGNHVHHFNILAPHREVRILAASIVETLPRPRPLTSSAVQHPLDGDQVALEALHYLDLRGPVGPTERLTPLLEKLRPPAGSRLAEFVAEVTRFIPGHFEYAKDVTLASSPIDDILEKGKGVCQDFTHLMIALLRAHGIPARYVSGYLHRPGKESQSHAWCEVWLPDLGWLGMDPTNNQQADDHFVKVAVGRDFSDVPPNKGVYRGQARESIFVRVETRELERLPPLSWKEQLPPLQVPLTAILPRGVSEPSGDDDPASQQ
jgi:transglutaminase-like putative cysteine protease